MAIPYTFATESGSVQASQLDANFTYVLNNTVSVSQANIFTALQTMSGAPFDEGKGANLASAATLNLDTMTGNYGVVTGTATITAITLASGAQRRLRASGAFTINNNALIKVSGGVNYTAAVGDLFFVWGDDAGIVYVVPFSVSGTPVSTIPVTQGGTGLTSGTSGGLPYFNSTTTMASSALLTANALMLGGGAGAAPTVLGSLGTTTTVLHGNAAGAPSFGAVSLTADVTGTLPTGSGGTGSASGSLASCNNLPLTTGISGASVQFVSNVSASVDMNAVADTVWTVTLPPGFTRYRVAFVYLYLPTADLTAATTVQVGLFTAAGGGGTTIIAATNATTTNNTANTANNFQVITPSSSVILTTGTLYFRVTTAHGSAATASVALSIQPIS